MIEIKGTSDNERAYKSLNEIEIRTKLGITKAFFSLGKSLRKDARKFIEEPPKTGRIYNIRLKGRRRRHQASAAGESPANISGALKNSVDYLAGSASELQFGAGGSNVKYAAALELGTSRIKKRPYLIRAINANERNAYVELCVNIKDEICK